MRLTTLIALNYTNHILKKNIKKRELTGFFIEDSEGKWRLPETIGNHNQNTK